MLIAIIADTHLPRAGRRLPERCLAQLHAAELILHAGDVSTEAALDDLAALGPPVVAVHGNVDEAALVRRLPGELEVEIDRVRVAMTHDAGAARGVWLGCASASLARTPSCSAIRTSRCMWPRRAFRSSTPAARPIAVASPSARWAWPR
jgi:Calcineurin-like phosphoesterase superfamily domain